MERMANRWWASRWVAIAVGGALLLLVVVTGIWPYSTDRGPAPFYFENHTEETVVVFYVPTAAPEFILIGAMEPGGSHGVSDIGPCTAAALVARNQAGAEIDRLDEPLCRGETWRIGGE